MAQLSQVTSILFAVCHSPGRAPAASRALGDVGARFLYCNKSSSFTRRKYHTANNPVLTPGPAHSFQIWFEHYVTSYNPACLMHFVMGLFEVVIPKMAFKFGAKN